MRRPGPLVDARLRILLVLTLTALPAAVEAEVLSSFRPRPPLGLSVLLTAPAPYGSLNDNP